MALEREAPFMEQSGKKRRMKRCILILLLGAVLAWPTSLLSQRLFFKPALGLSLGGRVSDTWNPTTSAFEYSVTAAEKTSPALDVSLEFIYCFNSSLSFSLGVGYFSRMEGLNGSEGLFSPPEASGFVDFSYTPWFKATVYPLSLSAIYSIPLMLEGRLNVRVGVEYYLGKVDCMDGVWWNAPLDSLSRWSRQEWEFRSDAQEVGFQVGLGIEKDLNANMIFVAEVIYRGAIFKEFKTSARYSADIEDGAGDLEGGPTFFYAKGIEAGEFLGDIDYRITRVDFSGLVFRIGFKFLLKR